MRRFAFAPLLLALPFAAPSGAAPTAWPVTLERLMAADAASYAPPDLKRQLARHRDRLMAGVTDAAASRPGPADGPAHRAAAARAARALAKSIGERAPFGDVAYQVGVIVHELAAALPPPPGADTTALSATGRTSRFLGYTAEPFRDAESLANAALPAATSREAYDAATTLSTRLVAWIWNSAGGDASLVRRFPDSKGPYTIRE